MKYLIKSGNPEKQRAACIVVGVFTLRKLSASAKALDNASKKYISNILRKGDMEGKPGQSLLLYNVPGILADRVLLIGCGKERDLNDDKYRKIIKHAIRELNHSGSIDAVCYLQELNIKNRNILWKIRQAVEATEHCLYEFKEYKSSNKGRQGKLNKLTLTVPTRKDLNSGEAAIADGLAIANGVKLTRNLANHPANICTPKYLADQARKMAKKFRTLSVKILEESDMEELGMGSLLAVSRGSKEPAKLIILEYNGAGNPGKSVALVGKGVTFDTGGISIKPAPAMDEMKYDMCGAASVLGTIRAIAELELEINVVGIIPATENMPGGSATRPGDIITSMSGKTIEILNTDAEGRLILCDALTYAERFEPEITIDIATLTGACVIALGNHASGLLSNHPPLVKDLLHAGEESGDRAWQLPLWDEYDEQIKSPFADMANIGGREAGTITAACFLARFTKKQQWAHLDIAGTAWISGKNKGATGRPVPLLVQYLLNRSR